MEVIAKPSFNRDTDFIDKELKLALEKKLLQIISAKNVSHVTGLKLLREYSHHYRIKVITQKHSYRIGAIIRGNKVWLVRFLSRKKIYKQFP